MNDFELILTTNEYFEEQDIIIPNKGCIPAKLIKCKRIRLSYRILPSDCSRCRTYEYYKKVMFMIDNMKRKKRMKDLVEMLQDIDEYGEDLTFKNKKFLDDMMRKAAGPPPIVFTDKQTKYIRSLWYEKVPEEWR